MNNNIISESAILKFFKSRGEFDKKLINCIQNDINETLINNNKNHKFSSQKEYQESFEKQIDFSKKFKDTEKSQIDSVIFHKDNTDGVSCAYLCWNFLTDKNKAKNILFKGIQPDHDKREMVSSHITEIEDKHIVGRNVIVLDLSFNKKTFEHIKNVSKSMIVIDNHPETMNNKNNKIFSSNNHAACASCFKFFFPKKKLPLWIQYVDNDDMKLFLPYLKHGSLFTTFMSVRIVKCNMITKRNGFDNMNSGAYEAMDKLLSDSSITWMIYAGSYMNEIKENFNQVAAKNARPMKFYGFDVVILNLELQGLDKNVARQAITNRKNYLKGGGGGKVDFAVLWSCHHNGNIKITLIDDHDHKNKLKMNEVAKKIANESQYSTGRAGGMAHIGNFFLKNTDPGFLKESKTKNLSY